TACAAPSPLWISPETAHSTLWRFKLPSSASRWKARSPRWMPMAWDMGLLGAVGGCVLADGLGGQAADPIVEQLVVVLGHDPGADQVAVIDADLDQLGVERGEVALLQGVDLVLVVLEDVAQVLHALLVQ